MKPNEPYVYGGEERDLVPVGKYEAVIERIEKRTTPNGKEKLSIMFRLRRDVNQPQGGRCIFEDIWKEKNTDFYNRKRLYQLIGTQHPEVGTVFPTIDDIITFLLNKPLIINVDIQLNDYSGEDENKIAFYETTQQKVATLPTVGVPIEEIDDDDLPF